MLGAAGVGAFLLWRRSKEVAAKGGNFCADVAQPLGRMVGFDIPPAVCGLQDAIGAVAGAVVDAVKDGWTHADEDRENTRLNGAVAVPLTEEVRWLTRTGMSNLSGTGTFYKAATVLRYQNGCEPFEGAPGWGKCAPGTVTMRYADPAFIVKPGTPKALTPYELRDAAVAPVNIARHLTGGDGDPTTLRTKAADGSVFIAGKKYTCPEGQFPKEVTDHRSGQPVLSVTCAPGTSLLDLSPWGEPETVPAQPKSTTTNTTSDPNDPSTWPKGYRWNPGPPGHWERA